MENMKTRGSLGRITLSKLRKPFCPILVFLRGWSLPYPLT